MKKKYFKEFDYKIFFKKLEIHKYENILINSNILEFLINQKRNKQIFKISKFVNHLINALNSKATLFIPAYNWDFCKGKIYDPQKTVNAKLNKGKTKKTKSKKKDKVDEQLLQGVCLI